MDDTHVGSLADLREGVSTLPAGMRISLMGKKGAVEGQRFSVDKTLVAIGRNSGDIIINQQTLSGRHAEIELVGKDAFVIDLKSTNGTFVNGEKIDRSPLKNLDTLKLGDLEFNVLIIEDRYMEQGSGSSGFDEEDDNELTELINEEVISGTRRLGSAPVCSNRKRATLTLPTTQAAKSGVTRESPVSSKPDEFDRVLFARIFTKPSFWPGIKQANNSGDRRELASVSASSMAL